MMVIYHDIAKNLAKTLQKPAVFEPILVPKYSCDMFLHEGNVASGIRMGEYTEDLTNVHRI